MSESFLISSRPKQHRPLDAGSDESEKSACAPISGTGLVLCLSWASMTLAPALATEVCMATEDEGQDVGA